MKILLCCHLPLTASFGGAKVYIENARSYEELGNEVKLVGLEDVFPDSFHLCLEERINLYPEMLLKFLAKVINKFDFDVIEYESLYFPMKRPVEFRDKVFVARSVLLENHFLERTMPSFNNIRAKISKITKGRKRRKELEHKVDINNISFKYADLINVPNYDDKDILVRSGHPIDKILVSPYGIYDDRLEELKKTQVRTSLPPVISFVGTFDPRKGAVEFPKIIRLVKEKYNGVIFRLIGTSSLFPDEESIMAYFPRDLSCNIEVLPKFTPEELPQLLSGSNMGIFPSHMESFGFGLLEMIAAGLPVVAYDVPGPNLILPKDFLFEAGDSQSIAEKIILILDSDAGFFYNQLKDIPGKFKWPELNIPTLHVYEKLLSKKRV